MLSFSAKVGVFVFILFYQILIVFWVEVTIDARMQLYTVLFSFSIVHSLSSFLAGLLQQKTLKCLIRWWDSVSDSLALLWPRWYFMYSHHYWSNISFFGSLLKVSLNFKKSNVALPFLVQSLEKEENRSQEFNWNQVVRSRLLQVFCYLFSSAELSVISLMLVSLASTN